MWFIFSLYLSVLLLMSIHSYRGATRLFSRNGAWHEINVTVRARIRGKHGTTFTMEGKATDENPRIFTLNLPGGGPWRPHPKPGDQLTFGLPTDGGASAAITTEDNGKLHLATLRVPKGFELRASRL